MNRMSADNRSRRVPAVRRALRQPNGGRGAMGRRRQLALVLLCATVTIAAWSAAKLGGFEWSDLENSATAILKRGAARGATISSVDVGPVARASVAATTSHRKLPALADQGARETGFGLAGVSADEAADVEAPDSDLTRPETHQRLVSLFRPQAPGEEQPPAVR